MSPDPRRPMPTIPPTSSVPTAGPAPLRTAPPAPPVAPAAPAAPGGARTAAFDSLRGLAAALVVLTHYLAAWLPVAVFGPDAPGRSGPGAHDGAWQALLLAPPASLATAAHFAVCLFFVLSGYVLSAGFVARPDPARLVGAVLKRGPRLAGIVLVSLALAVALIRTGLLFDDEALAHTGSLWLAGYWESPFDARAFAADLVRLRAGSEYVPPLWTLKIELIGSMLTFALVGAAMALGRVPALRHALFALALALTWGTYYDGFVAGAWLAHASAGWRGAPGGPAANGRGRAARRLALGATLAVASLPYYAAPSLWARLAPAGLDYPAATLHQVPMLAAIALFALVLTGPSLRAPLERSALVRLGELSYALYATHFLVLGSLSSWLVVELAPQVGRGAAFAISGLVSLPVLWGIAVLATRWVDRPSMALADALDRRARAALGPLLARGGAAA